MTEEFRALSGRLISGAFMPLRRVAGPVHRRRPSPAHEPNSDLPPLPAPWDDERWFRGGTPPRMHNTVKPLAHGDVYFADLYATLLEAKERVTICGWCLTPMIPLLRGEHEEDSMLADVLREVSARADVYVLLWCGAPALFEPTWSVVKKVQKTLRRVAPRVRFAADHSAPFSHDQHQKAVTIDGRIAYVGGMDLTTFQGDRWDRAHHPLRFGPNWHDAQVRLEGEAVHDVEANFCQRWNAVTGNHVEPLPVVTVDTSHRTPVQIVRTIPRGFYDFAPEGEFGILHALTTAIRRAERFVYLENQYIWAPEIMQALTDAMNRSRSGPFRVILVLPAKAYSGKYDNDEHVRQLTKVDAGRDIFRAFSLWSSGAAIGTYGFHSAPIYVHAKVSIVDDEWFSVGSANLNRRGLATDAEMNVHGIDPKIARALRVELWAEHLKMSVESIRDADPVGLAHSAWDASAHELEASIREQAPPRGGQVRVYVPDANPGSRILDLLQKDTLEK